MSVARTLGILGLGVAGAIAAFHLIGRRPDLSSSIPNRPTGEIVARAKVSQLGRTPETPPRDELLPSRDPQGVVVTEGGLSLRVHDRPLDWILEEISRQAEVTILAPEGLEGRRISDEFRDLPLDEGLRRILAEQDAFFFYAAGPSLEVVWVYPRDEGRGVEPVPQSDWTSTREFREQLDDADPRVRARAIEIVVERQGEQARDAALEALTDEDQWVRAHALHGALDEDLDLPVDLLSDLVLHDPSESVRFLALKALAGTPDAEQIAQYALNDPSPHLRSHARAILQRKEFRKHPAVSTPSSGRGGASQRGEEP